MNAAIKNNDAAMIRLLVDLGADLNEEDLFGNRILDKALGKAIKVKDEKMMRLFVELGADIDQENFFGNTAFDRAVKKKDTAMMSLLAELGADINTSAALVAFAEKGDIEMVKLMLNLGANINQENDRGNTALDVAIKKGHQDLADFLRQSGGKRSGWWKYVAGGALAGAALYGASQDSEQ